MPTTSTISRDAAGESLGNRLMAARIGELLARNLGAAAQAMRVFTKTGFPHSKSVFC